MRYLIAVLMLAACGDAADKRVVVNPQPTKQRETFADKLNEEASDSCHLCNPGNEYAGCFWYDDGGGHEEFFYYVDNHGQPERVAVDAEKAYRLFDSVCH